MRKLLAAVTVLVTVGATGASGIAGADEPAPAPAPGAGSAAPAPQRGTPGNAYALGGAHVLGIPYDEYIRRTGADWFPGLNRMNIQYPAGQVQGHTLERLFPGIESWMTVFQGWDSTARASASRSTWVRATSSVPSRRVVAARPWGYPRAPWCSTR